MLIQKASIVPGQPHLLLVPEKSAGWASLHKTCDGCGIVELMPAPPARTTVGVDSLPTPISIGLKVIAAC